MQEGPPLPELVGRIVTPDGIRTAKVRFDRLIRDVEPAGADDTGSLVVPGFIDLHVHGGGRADTMRGEADVRRLASFHARHGTTSLLPTTVTAPDDDLLRAAKGVAAVVAAPGPGEARVMGLHLEGPFISPQRIGAQPPFARPPDLAFFRELAARVPVRVLTMAPEIDPGFAFLRAATQAGCRCQIGHSDATDELTLAALAAGAAGFTHLFNAMRPFETRAPGVAGAALLAGAPAEVIVDLIHVAPGAIRLALRCCPGLYAITDAVEAAGCPDGEYRLGTHPIVKEGGSVRLRDGGLAGSILTMDQAFRNLVAIGLSLEQAVALTSTHAADYLGLADRGRLELGTRADILVLDPDLRLRRVFIGGEECDVADA
jgi:N-acetylglucosamine-6-phosphate deacetylase